MIRFFSGNNPFNVIILFFLGVLIRLPYFISPVVPQSAETDGIVYQLLIKGLHPTGQIFPIIYPVIVYLLVFTQAILFNGLINGQKLFHTPNYLLAFYYLVITAIMPEWNVLSPVVIINTILVWAWPGMVGLYHQTNPKKVLFNIGFGFGVAAFFYFPSVYLLLLLIVALLLFRPFYLTEWLVAILGILTPFYFLLVYLFVWDHWDLTSKVIPAQTFRLPVLSFDWKFWVEIALITLPLLADLLISLQSSSRLVVQIRKSWNFMVFYLIIALFIPFVNSYGGITHWMLAVIPISLFHASFGFNLKKKLIPELFVWFSLVWIVINYVALNG